MEIKILNEQNKKNVFYEVDYDDSFESIAEEFSVPVDYIKNNNSGNLYKGKIIYLPELFFDSYVVKPFDTLDLVAKKFGTTKENIIKKNSLSNEYIFIGQKLYI